MSGLVAGAAERVDLRAALADMVFVMIAASAREGRPAPGYAAIAAEARRQGLPSRYNWITGAIDRLERAGRLRREGATSRRSYALPGTAHVAIPSRYGSAGRLPPERPMPASPTLEERLAMYGGQRYEDVPHRQGRVVTLNPYLLPHGWASPLVDG